MSEITFLHPQIQLSLAKLGRAIGCDIWISPGDRQKEFEGERLSAFTIDELPSLGLPSTARDIIQYVDVMWFQEDRVEAAFGVEHSTDIYSGILRLNQCPGSKALYEELRKKIFGMGNDIAEGMSGKWIVYKRKGLSGSFCAIQLRKKIESITVSMNVGSDFKDNQGMAKKWRPNWAWFRIDSLDEVAYAIELVKQAYHSLEK